MKLNQLRYFHTICKYNNISKAAEELHITQPTLSHAIKELEDEFGISLFIRKNKGLELTQEGKIFLSEADLLLEHAESFSEHMHALGNTRQTIRLGLAPMVSLLVFPSLIHAFTTEYPHIRVQIDENGSITNKAKILDGSLDAAIISSLDSLPSSYNYHRICPLNIAFYCSVNHPLAKQNKVSLTDIGLSPLVLLSEDSFMTNYAIKSFKKAGITPNVVINTYQLKTIQQLVENNTVSTLLFDHTLEENNRIVKLPVTDMDPAMAFLVWNAHNTPSPATRSFIRTTKKYANGIHLLPVKV